MQKKEAFTVATSHLDTVWRWTLADTVEKFIPDTLAKNFDLIEKYPNYLFNFEGAYRYELIEEFYPAAFEKIRQYVRDGRWNPCGAEYESGDVNIPSPEAVARNILLGNNYFYEKLGVKSKDIFLPDCFGFGAQVPQIVNNAGLVGLTTQKLSWGSASGIPFDLGLWKGADNKEIAASLNAKSYRYKLNGDVRADISVIDGIAKSASESNGAFPCVNHLYGTGDKGGAPSEESVKSVNDSVADNKSHADFAVYSAKSEDVLNKIKALAATPQGQTLPRFSGDLLMTNHGAGCYTSRCQSKRLDYQCEQMAHAAEFACSFASLCGAYDYPKANLNQAWKREIRHQFHDDITGTSLMEVYTDAWDDYYASIAQFKGEFAGAMQALARNCDTSWLPKNSTGVTVANPMQYRRKEAVKITVRAAVNSPYIRIFDKQKQELPSEVISKTGKTFEVVFLADVPSFGAHIYAAVPSDTPCGIDTELKVTEHTLENKKFKIKFNKNGDLAFLFDKELNMQLIKRPIKMALHRDIGSLAYPSWELRKEDIDKDAYCFANTPEFEIVENGPARAAIKITREAEYSTVTQIVSLCPDSKFVRVDNFIEWRTRRTLLKAVFPLAAENYTAKYGTGIGYAERSTNTDSLYEVPAQGWAEITDKSGDFGITVLTDSKHGFDKPDSNTLRLTCIHTPTGAFTKETRQDLQDLGRNYFSFGIYAHLGAEENGVAEESAIFSKQLLAMQVKKQKHIGEFSQVASMLKISNDNVVATALKMSEDGDNALILRLCNPTSLAQKNAAVTFYREFAAVDEVNTSEEFIRNLEQKSGKVLHITLAPFEVKTLKIKFDKAESDAAKIKSCPIELPYNSKGFTSVSDMRHIILQGSGFSLPSELIGDKITVCGIDFNIKKGDGREYDVLVCRGEEIDLAANEFEQLHILAAAVGDEDIEEIFACGQSERRLKIKSSTAHYGDWDMYGLNQKARTDDKTVYGLEFSHVHHPEGNVLRKARFYVYTFNVKNKAKLVLPENNKLVILAATGTKKSEYKTLCTHHIDLAGDDYDFGEIPPIDKITDRTDAVTIRAGKIQDQHNGGKGKGFRRDNIITNIIRSYTKSEW